ncbi:hypothetical protein ACWCXC_15670 [Streptomyces sp. NPDC001515]
MSQIRDAQANGLEGTSAVLSAMSSRLDQLAAIAANRMTKSLHSAADYREDFRQDAALAMFEALPRFQGQSTDSFYGFMWTTVESVLKDKVRAARNQGVDEDATKVFAAMMERADNNVYLAEKFAQTVPPKGKRLSADRAEAARLAWQGARSLDAPTSVTHNSNGHQTIADDLESTYGIPEDLVTSEDISAEERREKHAVVNAILDVMSENQSNALRHSYGIGGVRCYGTGDSGDLEGLAAELGLSVIQVRDARTKGHKAFAKRFIKAMARTAEEAQAMEQAAASNLGRGGRK